MQPDHHSPSLLDQPQQSTLPLCTELDAEAIYADAAATAEAASAEREGSPAPRNPIFSGERLYRSDPERYRLFTRLYFEAGLSQMESCRLLSMSPQSGAAIISREQASMGAERLRQVQASRARAVVSLSLSAMQDRLSDPEALAAVPLRDLAQAAQRAHEIAALLSGEATSRTDRPAAGRASADDAAAYLDAVEVGPAHAPQSISEGVSGVARGAAEAGDGADLGAERDGGDGAGTDAHDAESRGLDAQGVEAQRLRGAAMPSATLAQASAGVADGAEVAQAGARG